MSEDEYHPLEAQFPPAATEVPTIDTPDEFLDARDLGDVVYTVTHDEVVLCEKRPGRTATDAHAKFNAALDIGDIVEVIRFETAGYWVMYVLHKLED